MKENWIFNDRTPISCMPENGALAIIPVNISYEDAASVPNGTLTALTFHRDKGNIQSEKTVLINGASGSIGTAAVQLARYYGAEVTRVCNTSSLKWVKPLGAKQVIDYTQEDFTEDGKTSTLETCPSRATAYWTLGFAYSLQGDRTAARQSYMESIRLGLECINIFTTGLTTNDLGYVQEIENQLHQAAKTYQRALQLFGDQPQPHAWQSFLGLARISYEWNDLNAAEQHGQQSLHLARQYEGTIDQFVI